MKALTIYKAATGAIVRRIFGAGVDAQGQCGPDEKCYEGALPLEGCRINLETGEPELFTPASPGSEVEWNDDAKTFLLTPAAVQRNETKAAIRELESSQARAIREHAIGRAGTPAELRKRLEDIDDQITELRKALS